MIIKADLALQVGTDLVKIDLSEETTNILHAVTMIRVLPKNNLMIFIQGDRDHDRRWDPDDPLHLSLREDQEGLQCGKILRGSSSQLDPIP